MGTLNCDTEMKIYIMEYGICGFFKLLFLFFAIYNFKVNGNVGHVQRLKYKWTNSFYIKMQLSFFISINYSGFALHLKKYYYFLLLNSLIWLISSCLLYFEFIRRIPQGWLDLRSFWLINGLLYIGKIIYLFSLIFLNQILERERKDILKLIIFNLVQSVPSLILAIFGFASNIDTPYEFEKKIVKSFTRINNVNNFIELNITEIKPNKFINERNFLIPVYDESYDGSMDKTKLRFNLILPQNINHMFKKSLAEVIQFNNQIQNEYLNNTELSKTNKPLIMQLKNLTQLFEKKVINESKLGELRLLYLQLCYNFPFFRDKFLDFCKIEDKELKDVIKKTLNEKMENQNKISSLILLNSDNSMEKKKEISLEESLQLKLEESVNIDREILKNSDIYKILEFISNVLLSNKYAIKFKVKTLVKKDELIDSNISCDAYYNKKTFNIEINIKNLINFLQLDKIINQSPKIGELLYFLNNNNKVLQLKNPPKGEAKFIEECINEIVNNLYLLDSNSFHIFNFNQFMHLDLEDIDLQIINTFFDMDKIIFTNNRFNESFYSKYSEWEISLGSINIKEKTITINISNETQKRLVESEINIIQFEENCMIIIENNKNFQRFDSITQSLETIKGIKKRFDNELHRANAIDQLIRLLNSFLVKKENLYIFYSIYFRTIFKVKELSKKVSLIEEESENEKEEDMNNANEEPKNIRKNSIMSNSMLEELLN